MDKISSFFDFVTNLPNCCAHLNNRYFAISQLWVDESWWNLHEECVSKIGLFWPKLIPIHIYLTEISPKKKHTCLIVVHAVFVLPSEEWGDLFQIRNFNQTIQGTKWTKSTPFEIKALTDNWVLQSIFKMQVTAFTSVPYFFFIKASI